MIEKIVDFIDRSSESIEREYKKDYKGVKGNPWLACFGSRTFGLKGLLELASLRKAISKEMIQKIDQKLEEVKSVARNVKNVYGWEPPEAIRKELIERLNEIVQVIKS